MGREFFRCRNRVVRELYGGLQDGLGHTPVASGTPGSYSDSGRGATLVLQIEGLGLPAAILAPRLGGVRGLVGLLRMSGASAARNMAHPPTRALLRHPLGNLQQVSPAHL